MKTIHHIVLGVVLLALLVGTAVGATDPVAEFNASPTLGTSPLTVQFMDDSYGGNITGWYWDFQNDGYIDSTQQYPVFTYTAVGNYSVRLTAFNDVGNSSSTLKTRYIIVIPPQVPTAEFTAVPRAGTSPLVVQFTDLSSGTLITSRAWDFNGDGITESTLQNPAFAYTTPGVYSVNLTVTNQYGIDREFKYEYISVSSPPPVANFTSYPRSGTLPLTVQFADLSTGSGISSWAWDFQNDGIPDSAAENPVFNYTAAGTYAVSLTVTNPGGNDTELKTGYITVSAPPLPVAEFTAAPVSGKKPLLVQFTDQSTGAGISAWAWDFNNDGVVDSRIQNPRYMYRSAGMYTVRLTVTSAVGSSSRTRYNYINVRK